jgi:hypothetical protein
MKTFRISGEMHIFISKVVNQMRIYNLNELFKWRQTILSINSSSLSRNRSFCSGLYEVDIAGVE